MFNVYSIENQNFYLNDSLISGAQALNISYGNNINTSLAIDSPDLNYFVSQPVIANIDLNYLLSSNDRFINYTGSSPFSGRIEYGNNYFTFSSGYLTNYSLNYTFGDYPKVDTKSLVFGELGNTSGTFSYTPKILNNFDIGDNCYADLNLDEANFNRLEAFNINIEVPRETVYTIGNYLPTNVIIKYPISISLNFSFSNIATVIPSFPFISNLLGSTSLNANPITLATGASVIYLLEKVTLIPKIPFSLTTIPLSNIDAASDPEFSVVNPKHGI
jgi:hypothetical protein